jgi:hypothetical protein
MYQQEIKAAPLPDNKDIEVDKIQPMLSQNVFKIITDEMGIIIKHIQKKYKITDQNFTEIYDKQIKNLSLKLGMKKRNRRILDNDIRCMGRKIDGKQCTRSRLTEGDFCKSHKDNLPHGRVDDPNYQPPEKGKRGRKKKSVDYTDGNYIATHLEMINGVQYLVNEEGLVFTYNIESPVFIGRKTKEGIIEKIESEKIESEDDVFKSVEIVNQ